MPLSSDPEKRTNQLANLRPNAAVKHAAWYQEQLEPLRLKYQAELRERFPSADDDELAIQASRLAQMHILTRFLDAANPVRPTAASAVKLLSQITVQPSAC